MKNLFKFLLIAFVFASAFITNAQQEDTNYFQLSPRIGYDFPSYDNNTPYIDYKGGLDLGLSLDYYWNWFGLGFDFDYIKNQPESTYPTDNLTDGTLPILDFSLTENKITRTFYGIGPNIQFRSQSKRFTTEINTRFGLASIKGGRTYLQSVAPSPAYPLNFHAGYDASSVFTFKGQVRFTYYLNDNFGINAGAYYMRHFGVTELFDTPLAVSAGYNPVVAGTLANGQPSNTVDFSNTQTRTEPCDCDISSVGLFAGVTFKFNKKEKVDVCEVCGEDHMPRCCATCGCGVTVTARDKFTNETLPFTDVVLADLNGNIVQSGTTNTYGVVVFNDVAEDDLIVKGKLYNISLEETSISKDEFKACKKDGNSLQKVIKYGDLNFILKGNVVECNTTVGIQGVDIKLRDKLNAGQKNT
jgi:hypothetical protein